MMCLVEAALLCALCILVGSGFCRLADIVLDRLADRRARRRA